MCEFSPTLNLESSFYSTFDSKLCPFMRPVHVLLKQILEPIYKVSRMPIHGATHVQLYKFCNSKPETSQPPLGINGSQPVLSGPLFRQLNIITILTLISNVGLSLRPQQQSPLSPSRLIPAGFSSHLGNLNNIQTWSARTTPTTTPRLFHWVHSPQSALHALSTLSSQSNPVCV